jgi:hypothetical protein
MQNNEICSGEGAMSASRFGLPAAAGRLLLIAACFTAVFAASAAQAGAAGCFAKPSACGYPDAGTVGVPAGTALTTVSSVTLGSGQSLVGKIVTNGVTVTGPNVTIRNSVIKTPDGGNGSTAIELANGATNFTIENSEVTGNGSKTNAPESNVWNHYNNAGFRVIGSYLHGVPDNIEGSVAEVRNSMIAVDAEYSGAHSENIYLCGASANVQHSTLYNESDETSLIFGDGICGKGNAVTVENSLLAGGGYMLQPNAKGVSAPVRIVSNRVGRCLTASHQDSGGGYVCASGADSQGFWPRGGHYGLSAELGREAVWSGNVWDDSSAAVCANEILGCAGTVNGGGVTPPSEEGGGTTPTENTNPVEPVEPTKPTEPTKPAKPVESSKPSDTGHGGGNSSTGEKSGASTSSPAPGGTGAAGGAGATKAIWAAPKAWVDGPVTLDGTESKGADQLTCVWTIEAGATTARRTGCRVQYRFRHAGVAQVTLTVRTADGVDRSRKTITVRARGAARAAVGRVASAARVAG